MATAFSAGWPIFLDGAQYTGLALRQLDSGVSVYDNGTAAATLPGGGVIDGSAASLKVTAPTSGLTVNVAPGYAIVPSSTAHGGAYRFGLMQPGSLTVASNGTGATRQDYVVASVTDLGSSSSTSQVAYVTGTTSPPSVPSNAIVLAQIAVPASASNITSGMITDKRTYVAAPGGVIPVMAATAAPAAPASQFLWNYGTGRLVQGSAAGTVKAWSASPGTSVLAGPNGTSSGGGFFGFGGGGPVTSWTFAASSGGFFGGPATGPQNVLTVTVQADGVTDFEVYYSAADIEVAGGSPTGSMGLAVLVDGSQRDCTWCDMTSTDPNGLSAGSTWYTSGAQGTTMGAGNHSVSLQLVPDFTNSGSGNQVSVIAPVWLRVTPCQQ